MEDSVTVTLTKAQAEVYEAMKKPGAKAYHMMGPEAYWIVDGLEGKKTRQVGKLIDLGLLVLHGDLGYRSYATIAEEVHSGE